MAASVTLASVANIFPAGTTVGAYPASNWHATLIPPSGAAVGAATTTAVVAADGSLAFTGLTEDTKYFAGADIGGGSWRYIGFFAPRGTVDAQDVEIVAVKTGLSLGTIDLAGDTSDLDSGAGTDAHDVIALGVAASGGHATVTGDATNGLDVDVTRVQGTVTTGHDTTGIGSNRKVVTTAGTRVALAGSTPAKWVVITAETDNTGVVVAGSAAGVIAALGTREGTPLSAGDHVAFPCDNLADFGLDSTVSGDGVTFTYGT